MDSGTGREYSSADINRCSGAEVRMRIFSWNPIDFSSVALAAPFMSSIRSDLWSHRRLYCGPQSVLSNIRGVSQGLKPRRDPTP